MGDREIFWDKNFSAQEAKQILKNENHDRFVYLAAIVLTRSNSPKNVFNDFLERKLFVTNWQRIKKKMRENNWSDSRIIFWEAICKTLKKQDEFKNITFRKQEKSIVSNQLRIIGIKIRDARKKKHMTQLQLAQETQISQQTISIVERGYSNSSFSNLEKIAQAVGLIINIDIENDAIMNSNYSISTSA